MSQGAANYTIQLNSATAEKRTGEHYVTTLDPSIRIPYLAKPRAMLESLSFSNQFANVDSKIDNKTVKLAWRSHVPGTGAKGDFKNLTLTVDDGYYDVQGLEVELARKLKRASTDSPTFSHDKQTSTIGSNLWDTMNTYAQANAAYPSDGCIRFSSKALIVSGSTTTADPLGVPQINVFDSSTGVTAGKLFLVIDAHTDVTNKLSGLDLYRDRDAAHIAQQTPPEWLIGSTLQSAIFNDGSTRDVSAIGSLDSANQLTVGTKIVGIHPLPEDAKILYADGGSGETLTLYSETKHGSNWALELDNTSLGITKTSVLVNEAVVNAQYSNGNTINVASTIEFCFKTPGVDDASFRGYGVKGLAEPALSATSEWGITLTCQELENITMTATTKANIVAVGTGTTQGERQYERAVKPFNFDAERSTSRLRYLPAWPGLYVCKGSTLFTKMLGFTDDQLCDETPTVAQMAIQNPFATKGSAPSLAVAPVKDRSLFKSTSEILVSRVRSLTFNCPSLVPPTYGPNGKLTGAQMCNVPVTAGHNEIQVYEAQYDNSVPCNLHGAAVSEIEFFLTDQTGGLIDLQKSSFQATIRVFHQDPIHPKIGDADAELDETIGIRDVTFRY